MMGWVTLALMGIGAYLLGAVNFGLLIGRVLGVDVRKEGSGNPGATNVTRVLGILPGMAVLLLDGLKGFAAAYAGVQFFGSAFYGLILGLAAVAGHNWPLYARFQGGKGVATTIGLFFAVTPWLALASGLLTLLVIAVSRYVSMGSLAFILLMAILIPLTGGDWREELVVLLLAMLIFWRHRANIARLLQGRERRFGHSNDGKEEGDE